MPELRYFTVSKKISVTVRAEDAIGATKVAEAAFSGHDKNDPVLDDSGNIIGTIRSARVHMDRLEVVQDG